MGDLGRVSASDVGNIKDFSLSNLKDGDELLCLDSEGVKVVSFMKNSDPRFYDPLLKSYFKENPKIFAPLYLKHDGHQESASVHDPRFFAIFLAAFPEIRDNYKWQVISNRV